MRTTQESDGVIDSAKLNRRVAIEIVGWKATRKTDPLGDEIWHWHTPEGKYIGYGFEPPGDWARNISHAFQLLARHCWDLHTCDAGYCCRIFTPPEHGELPLAKAIGESVSEAICLAILKLGSISELENKIKEAELKHGPVRRGTA